MGAATAQQLHRRDIKECTDLQEINELESILVGVTYKVEFDIGLS